MHKVVVCSFLMMMLLLLHLKKKHGSYDGRTAMPAAQGMRLIQLAATKAEA
jgi:hypothetical protein